LSHLLYGNGYGKSRDGSVGIAHFQVAVFWVVTPCRDHKTTWRLIPEDPDFNIISKLLTLLKIPRLIFLILIYIF